MTRRDFIWLLGLIGCAKETVRPKDMGVKAFHSIISSGNPFNLADHMDLVNLHSVNQSQMTVGAGNRISSWNDGISAWTNGTDSARPTLTAGVPTFDGGDSLFRAATITQTSFSVYFVFQNTGTNNKCLLGAFATNSYIIHQSSEDIALGIPGAGIKCTMRPGIGIGALSTRPVILAIRKNGNTVVASVNDRPLYVPTNSFAGETMSFDKIFGNNFGFVMTGELRALCMASSSLSDSVHSQVVNKLYSDYSLATENAAMTVFGFGDSNTAGVGSTSYLVGLAGDLNLHACNLGISGSRASAYDAASGVVTYPRLLSRPYTDYISIQYGTNDLGAGVSTDTYRAALNTIVGSLISGGHPAAKICLSTPPYQLSGANATGLNNYRTEVLGCATTYGTKYFDLLQDIRDNGADSLMYDTLHLNNSGQTRWRNGVYAAFTS